MKVNLRRLKSKIRHKCRKVQEIKSGRIYHNHFFEIVVSKKELMLQLEAAEDQTDLLHLLIYGKNLPDYETRLMKVGIKYELVSSMVYPAGRTRTAKPSADEYVARMFEGKYESFGEVKNEIEWIMESAVSENFALEVFQRLRFFISCACPFMADREVWWADTYMAIIEFAISDKMPEMGRCETIWGKRVNVRQSEFPSHAFPQYMPQLLADKISQLSEGSYIWT